MIAEAVGRLDRPFVGAVDDGAALGGDGDAARRRNRGLGFGDQGGDLGHRVARLVGPAGALANVGEPDVGIGVLGALAEQRRFLGAAYQDRRAALDRRIEGRDLGPAQLGVEGDVLAAGAAQRVGIQRHRAVAIAHQ